MRSAESDITTVAAGTLLVSADCSDSRMKSGTSCHVAFSVVLNKI